MYTHVNGSRYEGEWVNDVQQGQGEETWADGARYNGNYENGMKNGKFKERDTELAAASKNWQFL